MVLELIVSKSMDGFSANIPSIKGCETWANNEENAIDKSIDLMCFYLNLKQKKEIKIDRARVEKDKVIYKLIFNK
jgi:hypothetical protein